MKVAHPLPLLAQALSSPFGDREGFFQDFIAKLGPLRASGRVTFCSVREHWLHLYNTMESKMTLKRTEPAFVTETRMAPEELIVQFML